MKTDNTHELSVAPRWNVGPRMGVAALVILLPLLLVLEWSSGTAFSLHLFYLLPVSLAAWTFGYRGGFATATAAGGYCVFVALAMHPRSAPFAPLLWRATSTLVLFLVFAAAIAYHRAFIDRVVAASRVDFESGALAARELERSLDYEARRAHRYGRPLALAMLEAASDARDTRLPAKIVETLRRNVRDCDIVGRLSPRRFALVLVECPAADATRIAGRCREALEGALPKGVRFSLGAVSYRGSTPTNAARLLQVAESNMAGAKVGTVAPLAIPICE